ncbi:acetyltransferase [Cedecea neteri]|uniref:Acetyltransferase n=2 Tax=Cedecea neteri TaxID=158822 RepID=A0AAN0S874_9ENTR|nr:acetyltransferase [Cedecea neteri]
MLIKKAVSLLQLLHSQVIYKFCMKSFGSKSRIISPMLIVNPKYIEIGRGVLIRDGLRLEVVDPQNDVVISIGDNVNIEQNCHIIGRVRVSIGDNVTITGNCSIVDVSHPYEDINDKTKIGQRISNVAQPVIIGDGTFIGFGSHISPGVTIGKHCVVGAGAVVTRSIPDYSVVAGIPAKIIKRFSFEDNEWINIAS